MFAEVQEALRRNEERMQKQREELDVLKHNATVVRDVIQQEMQKYSNCQ